MGYSIYSLGGTPGIFPAHSKGTQRHLVPTLADGGCCTLCPHSPMAAVLLSEGAQSSARMLVAHVARRTSRHRLLESAWIVRRPRELGLRACAERAVIGVGLGAPPSAGLYWDCLSRFPAEQWDRLG